METRRVDHEKRDTGAGVMRRSCDQCRARKIRCDRSTPCLSCISSQLSCTHGVVSNNQTSCKQRVLISAQYEQKIDGIARDIDGIKHLLQALQLRPHEPRTLASMSLNPECGSITLVDCEGERSETDTGGEIIWGHSVHIVDAIKSMVRDDASRTTRPALQRIISSLQHLLRILEVPPGVKNATFSNHPRSRLEAELIMPPLQSAISILRWANGHSSNIRIRWLAQILPLAKFNMICQNVYFPIEQCTEIDYVLANGYLAYIFFEHVIVSGCEDSLTHFRLCRKNLDNVLSRLPLSMTASMEVAAALIIGAYNAVEYSRAYIAWTFISAAASHCLTLGYHHHRETSEMDEGLAASQQNLFWSVYRLDKGIALRLGRSSNIRDEDVLLSFSETSRGIQIARVQGRTYDGLYSPQSLLRPEAERAHIAQSLAIDTRQCIAKTRDAISALSNPVDNVVDPLGVFHLHCDLICELSLLTLILYAVPSSKENANHFSEECVFVAHEALCAHQQCMSTVCSNKHASLMLAHFSDWVIVQCPFPPFSVLFVHAVRRLDMSEIELLEVFAASLESRVSVPDSVAAAQPHRLYKLLCEAARWYINTTSTSDCEDAHQLQPFTFDEEITDSSSSCPIGALGSNEDWLGEWFYGNQLVMGVLDENTFC